MHGFGGFLFWGHLRCLSFPHQHLAEDASEDRGRRRAQRRLCPSSGESRREPEPAGERRARFPRCPGRGARSPAPAAAGAGRARAEQRCCGLPGQRPSPCCWERGSQTEPSRALRWAALAAAVLRQSQPSRADPVPDTRGPWLSAGREEILARPQSRLCLRREPLGAIPTATQARPPSQTPPLLPAPPLPPGGRRGSETVRV